MQNFDRPATPDEERQFQAGGQTFTIRKRVRPESLAALDGASLEGSIQENVDAIDALIQQFLVKGDRDRWVAARAQDDDDDLIIGLDEMKAISDWAIAVLSNRPLDSSASSGVSGSTAVEPSPAGFFGAGGQIRAVST